jgi:hypothetical protein
MEPTRIGQQTLSRRRLLRALGLLGLSAAACGPLPRRPRGLPVPLERHESAAVVGAEYLRRRPSEADRAILWRLLGLPDAWRGASERELATRLVDRHVDDFRSGRTLRLAGWTLSLTELRLCALVSLGG